MIPNSGMWHDLEKVNTIIIVLLLSPSSVKREPPNFIYKDYHEAAATTDEQVLQPQITGRKTRNSNGSRGVSSRAGLRSGKNYSKSDTDEEEG